jgi:hypothetical protein
VDVANASCAFRFTSPYDAVVAKVVSQTDNFVSFQNLLTIKGRVPTYFTVISAYEEQHRPYKSNGLQFVIPKPPCAGCTPAPQLNTGSTYFMTIYTVYGTSDYQIADRCGNYFSEVSGVFDPRILVYGAALYANQFGWDLWWPMCFCFLLLRSYHRLLLLFCLLA